METKGPWSGLCKPWKLTWKKKVCIANCHLWGSHFFPTMPGTISNHPLSSWKIWASVQNSFKEHSNLGMGWDWIGWIYLIRTLWLTPKAKTLLRLTGFGLILNQCFPLWSSQSHHNHYRFHFSQASAGSRFGQRLNLSQQKRFSAVISIWLRVPRSLGQNHSQAATRYHLPQSISILQYSHLSWNYCNYQMFEWN